MATIFAVVGEHCFIAHRLLVLGDDGLYYAWDLETDETTPVEPTPWEWCWDDERAGAPATPSDVAA